METVSPPDSSCVIMSHRVILEDFPKNELEFHERFSSEEACREYWIRVRWPNGFVCPACGHVGGTRLNSHEEIQCSNRGCRKQTSPRSGTILHKSPKPLRAWLLAMLHMTVNKQGISALRLQRLMGFGCYRTALRWLRELRRIMAATDESEKLGPEVEVDEKAIGGVEKGGKGPFVGKSWIVGAVERRGKGCGRARLRVMKDNVRNGDVLCSFVAEVVRKDSLVATDAFTGYGKLPELGYFHDPRTTTTGKGGGGGSNQLKLEDGREKSSVHLPRIHRVFSLVDRIVLGCLQGSFSDRHLQHYLDEYCFRFNRRYASTPLGIFQALVARAVANQCIPYWKSSGRKAPDKPTRQRNCEWQSFATDLKGLSLG
jgi:hypothetical protein